MSTLLSGGRAYGFAIEIVKSQSTSSSRTSQSSSPSSTISESSNSQVTISTRKPRTPRKRPNQTYNEAATLLSTACPNVFSTKHIKNISKFTSQQQHTSNYFFNELPELVLPFRMIENSGFLLHPPMIEVIEQPNCQIESKVVNSCEKPCLSPIEINSNPITTEFCDEYNDDFDTESMLDEDEEMGEGIDSIMGKILNQENYITDESITSSYYNNTCYGYPMRNSIRGLRNIDEGNWWSIPAPTMTVDIADIMPRPAKVVEEKKKKKKKKIEKTTTLTSVELKGRLLLKLNYDGVLKAWSDRGNPISDEGSTSESAGGAGNDIHARLAQIDLFSDKGELKESSVKKYKEKKQNSMFSKKIGNQVKNVNPDQRPKMKVLKSLY